MNSEGKRKERIFFCQGGRLRFVGIRGKGVGAYFGNGVGGRGSSLFRDRAWKDVEGLPKGGGVMHGSRKWERMKRTCLFFFFLQLQHPSYQMQSKVETEERENH